MWTRRAVVIVAVGVGLTGCVHIGDLSAPAQPPVPGRDLSVPELHGTDLGLAASDSPNAICTTNRLRWTPAGNEVSFITADGHSALAYQVPSGLRRQLYTTNPEGINDVQLSSDGQDVYTVTAYAKGWLDWTCTIDRHTADTTTALSSNGKNLGQGALLVAPGQAAAAYVESSYDLFLVRRNESPRQRGTGCNGLVAFSPDESEVLCNGFVTVHLDTGTLRPLTLPADVSQHPLAIRWDEGGIGVIYLSGTSRLAVYAQSTGAVREFPEAPVPVSADLVSWSRDGTMAAYWVPYCAQQLSTGACIIEQEFLYVLDVASGNSKRVAVHTVDPASRSRGDGSAVAISPTGLTVAYEINGHLYLVDVK
jgi:hypothetical protein